MVSHPGPPATGSRSAHTEQGRCSARLRVRRRASGVGGTPPGSVQGQRLPEDTHSTAVLSPTQQALGQRLQGFPYIARAALHARSHTNRYNNRSGNHPYRGPSPSPGHRHPASPATCLDWRGTTQRRTRPGGQGAAYRVARQSRSRPCPGRFNRNLVVWKLVFAFCADNSGQKSAKICSRERTLWISM